MLLAVVLGAGISGCTSGGGPGLQPPSTTAAPSGGSATTVSPGAGAPGARVDYVALGDSYTAGPLIPSLRLDPAGCLRSTHDYPAYLAGYLGVRSFRDVSCSGATTHDVFAAQAASFGSSRATNPAQLDAVRTGTDLVTVGLGGNDFGLFSTLTSRCARLAGADPTGAPCAQALGRGADALLSRAAAVRSRLTAVVRAVRQRAPRAQVVVVGYPRILPATGTCSPTLPFAAGDYRFADRVERALNTSLREGARALGATYVDVYAGSRGHDACAGAQAWVNGAQGDSSRAAAYHPFDAGMRGTAATIYRTLERAAPPDRPPFDSGAPTP